MQSAFVTDSARMASHRDNTSEVPTEQSTSWFNASYFPETSYLNNAHNHVDDIDEFLSEAYNRKVAEHFDDGAISSFTTPSSYEDLRKETAAAKTASVQDLILGSTSSQYMPYYPTNEEVPITAGIGTELINWKLCSGGTNSSHTGTRSQTSGGRSGGRSSSKNGNTPPTVCETATIVGGARTEVPADFNEDINLEDVVNENFSYLTRFKKQEDIIRNVDMVSKKHIELGVDGENLPTVASTAHFFPKWELKSYDNGPGAIDAGVINEMGMNFEGDADSTVSKSQTQSSVFSHRKHRAAASVTSYTDSSIAESAVGERYKPSVLPTPYPTFLHDFPEDDGQSYYSDLSNPNPIAIAAYNGNYAPVPDYRADLDAIAFLPSQPEYNNIYEPAQPHSNSSSSSPYSPYTAFVHNPLTKRPASQSPSPPCSKKKKQHICQNCALVFTEKTNLTRHLKSKKCASGGPDMFRCPIDGCRRYYEGRSDNLKTHMRKNHKMEFKILDVGTQKYTGDWKDRAGLQEHLIKYACAQ